MYISLSIIVSVRYFAVALELIKPCGIIDFAVGVVSLSGNLFFLSYEYFSLTGLLKEYHYKEYSNLKRTLRFFFIFEIIGVTADCIFCSIYLL